MAVPSDGDGTRRRPLPVRGFAAGTTRGWPAVLALVVVGAWLALTQLPVARRGGW